MDVAAEQREMRPRKWWTAVPELLEVFADARGAVLESPFSLRDEASFAGDDRATKNAHRTATAQSE
jgi:hypothetical protein